MRQFQLALVCGIALVATPLVAAGPKTVRLRDADLKQRVIWGSTVELPDGRKVSFGGQDQVADDGNPHTQIFENGEWKAIHEELRRANPTQAARDELLSVIRRLKPFATQYRRQALGGVLGSELENTPQLENGLKPFVSQIARAWDKNNLAQATPNDPRMTRAHARMLTLYKNWPIRSVGEARKVFQFVDATNIELALIAETLDAEPANRALSPLVFEPTTGLVVLFGGDHLDYLTNDTWVFDPQKPQWTLRQPKQTPAPRANHAWKALGDGKLLLTGGYTYASSTDYCGAQYAELSDGDWIYDVVSDTWSGDKELTEPNRRVYRTGPFHPDFYLDAPPPDRDGFNERLNKMPSNAWLATAPPKLPRLNRDWGTAVLDPDHDMILRFSGGHSAHGGTDVLHYHLGSNRWELSAPVEFPLGQLYSNTSYPAGVNFNRRPWVTGHTYQSYGYDPIARRMLFTGEQRHTYFYNPTLGDWEGRFRKPEAMSYDSCFYTLTLCPTPQGLVCWNQDGGLFRFDKAGPAWNKVQLSGEKLPGSSVDNSTIVHDSKRNRLLAVRKPYGDKERFDGQIHAIDCATGEVSKLSPDGMKGAAAIPYLCQLRYDPESDLLLVGGTLEPGEDGIRRTPAFDCAANAWVSLKITGTDPSGPKGRNVSLGLMHDPYRKLFWAIDTDSKVFVLRLDPKTADRRAM